MFPTVCQAFLPFFSKNVLKSVTVSLWGEKKLALQTEDVESSFYAFQHHRMESLYPVAGETKRLFCRSFVKNTGTRQTMGYSFTKMRGMMLTSSNQSDALGARLAAGLDVLVTSVSCGAGHIRAAQAVAAHVLRLRSDLRCIHHDLAADMPRWFRSLYVGGYNTLVSRCPTLFGLLYDSSDAGDDPQPTFWQRRAYWLQSLAMRRVLHGLEDHPPRVIVHAHYLLPPAIHSHWHGQKPPFPQAVCVTDYEIHRYWRMEGIDKWFVANDLCRESLAGMGIDRQKIDVTGIPLLPCWSEPSDPARMQAELALEPGRRVMLLSAGASFVSHGFEQTITACLAALPEAHCIVLTGRNRQLQETLERMRPRYPRLRVVPFTERVPELMSAADLLVTKPGGLTTSEALTRGLPMIFVNPVPGQEVCNAEHLIAAGVAIRAYHPRTLPIHIKTLLGDKSRLEDMRHKALALAKPDAGRKIAEWAIAQTR